jgi:predicted Zn-dependent protease
MRKLFIIVVACAALLLAGYAGHRSYKVWKNKHLMTLCHQFLAKSDARNAVLSVQAVLHSDPNNLDAIRVMAQLAEASHLPAALLWRSRAVDLDPHSLKDRLALAQTALTLRDYQTATNALEGVDARDKETASYHNIAGTVAAAANHPEQAESHFLAASRIEPNNPAPQLNLAVVRLHGTNALDLEEARIVLQRLSSNPTNAALRCQALRELTLDAMGHKREDLGLAYSRQLTKETNSAFTDRILRLEVLRETKSVDFKPELAACQRSAATNQTDIYELASWEMAKNSPESALTWLHSLPANMQTNQPTTMLIAEYYAASKNWRALNTWLEKQRWAELEFVRHAFMSRAFRGLELPDTAKTEWEQALKSANGQKQSLVMLLRLAAQWKWVSEGEDLLWTIITRYPQEKWASQTLAQTLFAGGQTRSLMQLFNQELKATPANLSAKNNLAMVALLLGDKTLNPYDLAREVYQQAPTNSSYAATYAYSLYLQGKSNEALKVMQKVKPSDLDNPSIAGYYGIILKATGSRANAKVYLNKASKARLLPEEQKLFTQAKAGI